MNDQNSNSIIKAQDTPALQAGDTEKHTRQKTKKRQYRNLGLAILIVVSMVAMAHRPALSARALSFDDHHYLVNNPLVQNPSLSSAARFFTEVLKPSTVKGYYQPVTMISLMLDFAIAGGTDDLRPYHRTSLCIHVANTALVVVILYMLFGQVWPAAMAALIYGLHPLNVDSIAWIAERKTVLASFFVYCSIICYLLYVRNKNRRMYLVCTLMYVLALLSKPTSIALAVLLLLLDYWPLNRFGWAAIKEKVPLFAIAVAFAAITVISQSRAGAAVMPTQRSYVLIPLIIAHNIRFYLYKILWPASLGPHYPFPEPFLLSHPDISGGVLTSAVLIVVLFLSLRRTRALMVGFLFFFLSILPTMHIVGFTNAIAANRYVYLPAFGLLLPLTFLLSRLWLDWSQRPFAKLRLWAFVAIVAAVAVAEAFTAGRYAAYWKDTLTVYSRMRQFDSRSPELAIGFARAQREEGKLDEAIEILQSQLELTPRYQRVLLTLGTLLGEKGQLEQSIEYLTLAAELEPDDPGTRLNLGTILAKHGNLDEAIKQLRHAVRIDPQSADSHSKLAIALLGKGLIDESVAEFAAALRINPYLAPAQGGLKAALAKKLAKNSQDRTK